MNDVVKFEVLLEQWHQENILNEKKQRRREYLEKGLGHGTIEFLRTIWFPTFGNLNHLYPEWEVRDYNNNYRYLDLAYLPGSGAKGCIEIQGYGPHARDINVTRFKDLCWRHSLLALEGWTILPIAYLSIKEEPELCRQLMLAFVGKFISIQVPSTFSSQEAEIIRYARRIPRPFSPIEIANHLNISDRHARRILQHLLNENIITVASGNKRLRTYRLAL